MEGNNRSSQEELTMEVVINGHKLIVTATKIENEGWQLSIVNEYGIFTNWVEYFTAAEIAINTGLKAIETEGIDEFVKPEGFDYLYENYV